MNEAQHLDLNAELLKKLDLPPHAIETNLLRQALTHKSVLADRNANSLIHNERLEYLGDAFLKSSISEWLFTHLSDASEGHMSQIRAYVVSDAALSKAAQRLELARHIYVGESEQADRHGIRESILANVLESLCGAIFLSTDFRTTARIILKLLTPELKLAVLGQAEEVQNYKALLQEYAQGKYKELPVYELTEAEGPDHDRTFHIQVHVQNEILGQGSGRSKKKAEQEAAREALIHLNQLGQEPQPISQAAAQFFAQQTVQPQTAKAPKPQNPQKLKLAPSVLSADFAHLGQALKHIAAGGVDWVHLDIMDGHFVPNLTFGPPVVKALRPLSNATFDAHLMIQEPEKYVEAFAKAGCNYITVHYETCPHLDRTLAQIREAGAQAGVALNPATPVQVLEDVLHKLDLVLLMSVNPGFGGQKFIPQTLKKLEKLVALRAQLALEDQILIQVDGGLNQETLKAVVSAGAEVLVMGSAVFSQADPVRSMQHYQQELWQLEQV